MQDTIDSSVTFDAAAAIVGSDTVDEVSITCGIWLTSIAQLNNRTYETQNLIKMVHGVYHLNPSLCFVGTFSSDVARG